VLSFRQEINVMKKFLSMVVFLAYGTALAQAPQTIRLKEAIADFPRSQLELKTNGPVSISVDQGERAAYEKLAQIAGLNIVFDRTFAIVRIRHLVLRTRTSFKHSIFCPHGPIVSSKS